jgi:sirohydrochlorin cobaltochelatase
LAAGKISALVIFAHGAREAQWAEPFTAIRDRVASARPDLSVEVAFLESMAPQLGDCIAKLAAGGHRRVVVAPVFLALGGHLKHDLPRLVAGIRERHPGLAIELLPPIGEVPELLQAIAGWLVNAAPR